MQLNRSHRAPHFSSESKYRQAGYDTASLKAVKPGSGNRALFLGPQASCLHSP